MTDSRWRTGIGAPLVAIAVAVGVAVAGCSSDSSSTTGSDAQLTPSAQQGLDIAQARGCTNCHTTSGRPGTGPTWKGIWGTEVELTEGRTVTVDAEYIRRSIQDPRADEVSGFASSMPELALTDDEIAAITDLVRELGPSENETPP